MKKILFSISLWALALLANAQLRYDANWVFGIKGGITFNEDSLSFFEPDVYMHENTACISDSTGRLLFYFNSSNTNITGLNILDANGIIINNIDSPLLTSSSWVNGIVILPYSSNLYYIIHVSDEYWVSNQVKNFIYYSIVEVINNQLFIRKWNIPLYNESSVEEKLTAVKHANGKDWWIIAGEQDNNCTDDYLLFKFQNENIELYNIQNVGTFRCSESFVNSEMKISKLGNTICNCIKKNNIIQEAGNYVDILSFNRCTGELLLNYGKNITNVYSCDFSNNENYIYAVSTNGDPFQFYNNTIFQIDNFGNNSMRGIGSIFSRDTAIKQIEIGPDNKIYVSIGWTQFSGGFFNYNNYPIKSIGVIESPDSFGLASNFNAYGTLLSDSSRATFGLPNFPNYRLGALSIYEAGAGSDTVICTDSTINQKVVQLGSQKVNGVQYQWYPNYNLSSDTTAQPLAFPDSTTMYYVMLSDTSIKNACKTRLDSVWVEVRMCNTSVNSLQSTDHSVKVYPNPATNEIKIKSERHKIAHVVIHDIAGKIIPLQLPLAKGERGAVVNINHLPQGIYFIETQLTNGQTTINKLVKQ
jgi:hypothetical protein